MATDQGVPERAPLDDDDGWLCPACGHDLDVDHDLRASDGCDGCTKCHFLRHATMYHVADLIGFGLVVFAALYLAWQIWRAYQ